jgi:hypothetical protein
MKSCHIARKVAPLVASASLLTLASCNEFVMQPHHTVVPSHMAHEAVYKAELRPINSLGEMSGHVSIRVADGQVHVETEFQGPASEEEVMHPQNLRTMSHCPDMARHDLNQDGFIDAQEGKAVYGDILISMDDDLTTSSRSQTYPTSDRTGKFFYSQMSSLSEMRELFQSQHIDFSKYVVVVEGVASSVELPDTVQTAQGGNPHQTLPIACGRLMLQEQQEHTPPPGHEMRERQQRQRQHQQRQQRQQQSSAQWGTPESNPEMPMDFSTEL